MSGRRQHTRAACGCAGYSRAQLLRGAAAEAGNGLPAIEPGMPLPAGTGLSRRGFLLRSAGLALTVYGGAALAPRALEAGIEDAMAAGPVGRRARRDLPARRHRLDERPVPDRPLAVPGAATDARAVARRDAAVRRGLDAALASERRAARRAPRGGQGRRASRRSATRARTSRTSRAGTTGRSARRTPTAGSAGSAATSTGTAAADNPLQGLTLGWQARRPRSRPAANPVATVIAPDRYDFTAPGVRAPDRGRRCSRSSRRSARLSTTDPSLAYARRTTTASAKLRTDLAGLGTVTTCRRAIRRQRVRPANGGPGDHAVRRPAARVRRARRAGRLRHPCEPGGTASPATSRTSPRR